MFHFGFSYTGLIYLLMLFIPNIIWTKKKPENYSQYAGRENRILLVMERAGESLVCCFSLIFSDFNIRIDSLWCLWLLISFALMVLYEIYWIRYFKSERKMSDFYKSICKIPVAGAVLPVFSFFFLGIYRTNIFLIISTIILGIGHIGIHLNHYKEISGNKNKGKIFVRIVKWGITGISAIVFGIIVFFIGCRNINYFKHYANIHAGVDEGIFVPLGGQNQYVLIRGKDSKNPVIVYLHGGPASPDTGCTYGFTDYLTDDYTVAAWDQRGCGRTYFKNMDADPDNETASFEQAVRDLDELVDYVCRRFNKDKVIIMGHSYGTILGSHYALTHPEKVLAYVGAAQVLSMKETDIYSYEDALSKAEDAGDDTSEMVSAFKEYQEAYSLTSLMKLRSYTSKYHPAEFSDKSTWLALTSPYFGMDDFKWFLKQLDIENFFKLNEQLFDFTVEFDIGKSGMEYPFPVYFISGSCDWVCPIGPIEEYMEGIDSKDKEMVLIDGCGHSMQYSLPRKFSREVKRVLKGLPNK